MAIIKKTIEDKIDDLLGRPTPEEYRRGFDTIGRLSTDTIERRAERLMDHLDALLLLGALTQKSYDLAVRDLNRWVKVQYARAAP